MKIAVISDIHANIHALRAVLDDIGRQAPDRIYCTGDLVGYAAYPNEVIDLVRQMNIPTVMGNYDDAVGNMRLICGCDYKNEKAQELGEQSISWTKQHTSEQNKDFLRKLPQEIRFDAGGQSILLVHGSPNRLNEYIYQETPEDYLAELLSAGQADVLVCGHTHRPFHRQVRGKHVINAGSVGKPKHGGPQATYVTVTFGDGVDVKVREVQYDVEAAATAIGQSGLPPGFAEMLRSGKG